MYAGPKPVYRPESFQLRKLDRVGNYALQPSWADGHDYGIWPFDKLREFCSCDECRAKSSAT